MTQKIRLCWLVALLIGCANSEPAGSVGAASAQADATSVGDTATNSPDSAVADAGVVGGLDGQSLADASAQQDAGIADAAGDAAVDAAVDAVADTVDDGLSDALSAVDSGPLADVDADAGIDTDTAASDTTADTTTWPVLLPPVYADDKQLSEFYVTIRTGDGINDATNDPFELCLADATCWNLDNAEIDDRELGAVDHYRLPAKGLTKAKIDRIVLQAVNGTNAWMPTCVAVVADGELLFCYAAITAKLSTQGGSEKPNWQAANPKSKECSSCYNASMLTATPMVGHTHTTGLRVWSHASAAWPTQLEVATNAQFTQPLVGPPLLPTQANGFMAAATVEGLQPATAYWYRLKLDGKVIYTSPSAVITAPLGGSKSTGSKSTFALASCAKFDDQPAFAAIGALQPNALLMVGDNHYGNTADLDNLRWWYRKMHAEPHFAKVGAASPTWAIWDDHDFVGNNTNGKAAGKEKALAAFAQSWANPSAGTAQTAGVFTQFAWGQTDVFLVDGRYWRDIEGDLLGSAQTAWLKAALKASTATFKLVACGSRWTTKGSGDSWAAYPLAQAALVDFIFTNKINGVILLSGDIHRHEVRKIVAAGAGQYPLYELTSSPIANVPSPCKAADNEQLFCAAVNGFGWIAIDTTVNPATLTHQVRDEKGKVLYSLTLSAADLVVK
ncbi:MAG: hypothetical protein EXR77_17500 [Myxococcales bacterium]|nr:hypothetical protein [Myxococcales bacterium]